MTSSDQPRRGPSPEDEGIPDYADDTSTAFDETERPRFNDSPYPAPGDEPQGLDEYGLTAAEQRHDEPIDERLDREEPDLGIDDAWPEPAGGGLSAEEAAMHGVTEDELVEDDERHDR